MGKLFGTSMARAVAALAAVTVVAAGVGVASAVDPSAAATPEPTGLGDGSHIDHVVPIDARRSTMYVYSAAMNRVIGLNVLRAPDTSRPAPTLYLLNGAEDGIGPGGQETSWETKTDIAQFTADKDVNVVNVLDGRYTYYTDWQTDDPVLGRNKWTTFLTRELPPIIDAALNGNGRNAIAGVSMSATSVLQLAEAAPGLYRSVGSFSGCDETSTDPGRRYLQAVVMSGGGNPWNIWGRDNAPGWAANDPATDANLVKLRGVNVVVGAGVGRAQPNGVVPPNTVVSGRLLESAVATCTRELQTRTERLGVPVTYNYLPGGLHNWPYWQQELHQAWPSFARSIGI